MTAAVRGLGEAEPGIAATRFSSADMLHALLRCATANGSPSCGGRWLEGKTSYLKA
ncbi:hypothetical protein [Verminephrobacter aporrectodeae]|uniref:hypothetical protein n=1 Tax=Verminephrobacter aporrectodeae TaxID=1110389 RepID=UPI000237739C|nr:hypothetical protein [Verminephrobacter aporrectodeae]